MNIKSAGLTAFLLTLFFIVALLGLIFPKVSLAQTLDDCLQDCVDQFNDPGCMDACYVQYGGGSGGGGGGTGGPSGEFNNLDQLLGRACEILQYVFAVLIFLSIAMGLYAGFLYATSSGDPEKIKKSNHILLYAAIALAVGILARSFPWIVSGLFLDVDPTGPGISSLKSSC